MNIMNIKGILSVGASFEDRFIPDLEQLKIVTKNLQDSGYRIVLTQGVYDLIHEGHGKYLARAKEQGDILIVGVDSDELTRKRKGENRPVVPETERLRMLTLLRSVDIVTVRAIDKATVDIDYLYKAIRPNVLVISTTTKDFPIDKKNEIEQIVDEVVIFEPQAETSSTARIRNLMIDGVAGLEVELNKTVQEYLRKIGGQS